MHKNYMGAMNYQFTYSYFDEVTTNFKNVVYQAPNSNFTVKAVSQNCKCALLYDPKVGSERFQIVDFSPETTAVLKKELLSASLTASTVSSATTFAVANDCNAFQMGDKVYRNRSGNVFETPYTLNVSGTDIVFS